VGPHVVLPPGARQVDVDDPAHLPGAARQHQDPVGEQHRLVEVVGDEHDRLAGLGPDPHELFLHVLAGLGVDRAERLVHEQDLRVGREGPGDPDPLLHPAGELVRVARGEPFQPDPAQLLTGALGGLGGGHLPDRQREHDVVQDGPPREEPERLEHHGALRARAGDLPTVDAHGARVRGLEARDDPQQRRLPATARPDDREELVGADVEVDAAEGGDDLLAAAAGPAERLLDAGEPDLGLHDGSGGVRGHAAPPSAGSAPTRSATASRIVG